MSCPVAPMLSPVSVELPRSKSMSARALVLDYISGGNGRIPHLAECDDTAELQAALAQLRSRGRNDVYNLGLGATSLRFFTALAASIPGFKGVVDAAPALRGRPLRPLLNALRAAGADIRCLQRPDSPPLLIRGKKLSPAGVTVDSSLSSQYASALVLASPLWTGLWTPAGENLDTMRSRSYLDMTLAMRSAWAEGAPVEIEADWSAAAFFYEYALLHPGVPLYMPGLKMPESSLQGDAECARLFGRLGVVTVATGGGVVAMGRHLGEGSLFSADMSNVPDLVPPLVCGLVARGMPFELSGVANLRVKECDRLEALRAEWAKAGGVLEVGSDSLSFGGGCRASNLPVCFSTWGDHRIAMAFAVVARVLPACSVSDPAGVVSKSFPGFYAQLGRFP